MSKKDEQKATPMRGVDVIRNALKSLSNKPGVYRMLDNEGDALYVGKAKNLKNRVANYTSTNQLTTRIMRMVEHTRKLEIVETGSEAEALLLEANLIKKLKPRYNILLRDDKTFPYIVIDKSHDYPRISKHRGAQKKGRDYYGPFASVGAVNQTLAILQKAFLLRPCTDSIFANRARPCLQYQIKRCSAPCVDYVNKDDYADALDKATQFLKGKNREVQEDFATQMEQFSELQDYEKAAEMRDRIKALTQVQQEQNLRTAGLSDADVIALSGASGQSCIQVFFFRGGCHFGNQPYFPRHEKDASAKDIISAFIGQFYQTHTPPNEILVNHTLEDQPVIEEALSLRAGYQVKLHQPQRGDKREIVKQAETNAKSALERRMAERMSERRNLEALAKLFALDSEPKRIEVYDNSHIMGRHALGAMIVAGPEGFDKKSYRQFNIKDVTIEPGDDYGMMREVFTRRFARLQKDDPDKQKDGWPDLVLIDGGRGQLNAVTDVFADLGVTGVPYCAIAKGPDRNAGREDFYLPERDPFSLPPNDPTMHYLQRLRDEAHRFAIGSHRVKRAKTLSKSGLDDISGIGATRKRALLHHFGSPLAVEKATLAELQQVDGINSKVAQTIYDYFHG